MLDAVTLDQLRTFIATVAAVRRSAGAFIEPVLQGTCQIGIVGSLPVLPETMHSELLLDVPLVTVVAPTHPLASYKGIVPQSELQRHVQLVLTDRSTLSKGQSYGVFSKTFGGSPTWVPGTPSYVPASASATCRDSWLKTKSPTANCALFESNCQAI